MYSRFLASVVLSLLFSWTAGAQQENVLDVGTRSQLFADPNLVHESSRVAFTAHTGRKHQANPFFKADQPWEGWYASIFGGTVLFDEQEKRFKMWYTGPGGRDFFDHGVVCYAVSRDGLRWEKPAVGTLKSKNGMPHGAVVAADCPSVQGCR